jgi:hypothetical protein
MTPFFQTTLDVVVIFAYATIFADSPAQKYNSNLLECIYLQVMTLLDMPQQYGTHIHPCILAGLSEPSQQVHLLSPRMHLPSTNNNYGDNM